MNNKKYLGFGLATTILLFGLGIFLYTNNTEDVNNQKAINSEEESVDSLEKTDDMVQEQVKLSDHGSYINLSDYNSDSVKYADTKNVYFFHASWCPICQTIEKEINKDITKIPAGVTFIKTDFDSNTELRKKYGVTTQYTFVQVDENGNETKQWSASSLSKAIDGIEL
jgi:thiol-disulfide isomerase/thioredoxin